MNTSIAYKMWTILATLIITFSVVLGVDPLKCNSQNSIDISGGEHFTNGSITYKDITYEPHEYYIDNITNIERGCICSKTTCARKCCPFGLGYNLEERRCLNVTEFKPKIWNNLQSSKAENISSMYYFLIGKMNCTKPEARIPIANAVDEFHLQADGQLYISVQNNIPPFLVNGPDRYCIDTFVTKNNDGTQTELLNALICFAEQQINRSIYIPSSSCMLISCVFIIVTIAVYAWLPELRNLYGMVLMAYLICIFFGFLFLASMQIMLIIDNINSETCLVLTFLIYFTLLAAFFWLNVMCFDIWWTFSGKRGQGGQMSARKRFGMYAIYAFSIPTLLTILLAALEFSGLPWHPLLPLLRLQGCFIFGKSKVIYFYTPILILCLANIIFFALTAYKIYRTKQETKVLKSKESSTHDEQRKDKQRLVLYVKLFAVMGVSWILEIVSYFYPDATYLWNVTDAYNVLVGPIIFFIFVCKKKIFQLIKRRYKQVIGATLSRTQTASTSLNTMANRGSRDNVPMGNVKEN